MVSFPRFASICLLVVSMPLGIAGCGGSEDGSESNSSAGTTASKSSGTQNNSLNNESDTAGTETADDVFEADEKVHRRVMRPYDTIDFTDAQTNEIKRIINNNVEPYVLLEQTRSELMAKEQTEEIKTQLDDVNKQIADTLRDVRIHVKNVFTPAQMEQHRAEAKARRESQEANQ